MAPDYAFASGNINYGIESGYLVKLNTINSEKWTVNPDTDNKTVFIPSADWVHMKVMYQNDTVSLKISDGEEVLFHDIVTPYSEQTIPCGLCLRGGKNNAVMDIDNVSLKIKEDDSFRSYFLFRSETEVGAVIMPDAEGTVYTALYSGDGSLLAVQRVQGSGTVQTVTFPVPQESGAYIKLMNWGDDMKPLCRAGKQTNIQDIDADAADYALQGRKVYAFGDSIVFGHTAPEKSFMRMIADTYEMELTMGAVNGATVIESDNDIITQIKNAPSEKPDVIVFDGYTNDAYGKDAKHPVSVMDRLGEIQGSAASSFDRTTFCGGFEEILYTMKQRWPDTPIVFVTIHKSDARDWKIQCKLRSLALEMCHEWGVETADIFQDASLDTRDSEQMKKYIIGGAGSHPNADGCKEFYVPNVVKTLKRALGGKNSGILPDYIDETVDLALFAGQSNMSGRGSAAEAVVCDLKAGFEYKSVSQPNTLVPVAEPFGLGEDTEGGIWDYDSNGQTKRSGSMVSAAVDEYFRQTGRQLVAVSASIGGTSSAEWKDKYAAEAVSRLDAANKFLARSGIKVGRIFAVWCQGETDGDHNINAQTYMDNTKAVMNLMKEHGVQKCFMVQTGHYNYLDYPGTDHEGEAMDAKYGVIRDAQSALCGTDAAFVMAASFEPYIGSMKDRYHYRQNAYNEVGAEAGRRIGQFYMNPAAETCGGERGEA